MNGAFAGGISSFNSSSRLSRRSSFAPLAVGGGLVLLCLAVLLPLAHLSHAWFETPARRGLSTLLAASPERRRAARARLQGAGTGAPQP